MIVLGCDPDLHHTGLALLRDGKPIALGVALAPPHLKRVDAVLGMCAALPDALSDLFLQAGWTNRGADRVIVESQQIYYGKSNVRPDDLILLAQVAGACCTLGSFLADDIRLPKPNQWKGSIPKMVKQRRILDKLGWGHLCTKTTVKPKHCPLDLKLTGTNWSHVLDAIGLAQWGEAIRAEPAP